MLLCAALLLGNLPRLFAQDLSLQIIPRFEVEPQVAVSKDSRDAVREHNNLNGEEGFYSNTSLYTHFEGEIIPGLSFNLINHWVAGSASEIQSLYENTWTTDNNWCDYATLTYEYEGFSVTLGKECLAVATYEYDPYDYDCYYVLSSGMWNNLNCYQWGAKVAYAPSDNLEFGFQFSSSPFNEKPFSDGYFSYSAYGFYDKDEDEDEGLSFRLSLNAMQFEKAIKGVPGSKANFIWQPALGLRYDINDFYVGLDAAARFASSSIYDAIAGGLPDSDLTPIREGNIILNLGYYVEDELEVFARAGWEPVSGAYTYLNYAETTGPNDEYAIAYPKGRGFLGGIGVHWYPLPESNDLRVHAVIGGSNYSQAISMNFGVTYFFQPLKLFARK